MGSITETIKDTMDAYDSTQQNQGVESETFWGVPKTTEKMIENINYLCLKKLVLN